MSWWISGDVVIDQDAPKERTDQEFPAADQESVTASRLEMWS